MTDLSGVATGQNGDRPNIIFINIDDMRPDELQYMPFVSGTLMRNGTEFQNAFVTTALCGPSRNSLLTGLYASSNGSYENIAPLGGRLNVDQSVTIATLLDDHYRTASFGKFETVYQELLSSRPDAIPPGWDEFSTALGADRVADEFGLFHSIADRNGVHHEQVLDYDRPLNDLGSTTVWRDLSNDFLVRFANGDGETTSGEQDENFFLYFAPTTSHSPYNVSPEFQGVYDDAELEDVIGSHPWTKPEIDESFDLRMSYYDADGNLRTAESVFETPEAFTPAQFERFRRDRVRHLEGLLEIDAAIASITQTLVETGQFENTVIVVTADNGQRWGEHGINSGKDTPHEESLRVPLIVFDGRSSDHVATQASAWVDQTDFLPTIAELGGIDLGEHRFDGQSFTADIATETPSELGEETLRIEHWWNPGYRTRIRDYRVIVNTDPNDPQSWNETQATQAIGIRYRDPETGTVWKLNQYLGDTPSVPGKETYELFNLSSPEGESVNLAYRSEYQTIRSELVTRLGALFPETTAAPVTESVEITPQWDAVAGTLTLRISGTTSVRELLAAADENRSLLDNPLAERSSGIRIKSPEYLVVGEEPRSMNFGDLTPLETPSGTFTDVIHEFFGHLPASHLLSDGVTIQVRSRTNEGSWEPEFADRFDDVNRGVATWTPTRLPERTHIGVTLDDAQTGRGSIAQVGGAHRVILHGDQTVRVSVDALDTSANQHLFRIDDETGEAVLVGSMSIANGLASLSVPMGEGTLTPGMNTLFVMREQDGELSFSEAIRIHIVAQLPSSSGGTARVFLSEGLGRWRNTAVIGIDASTDRAFLDARHGLAISVRTNSEDSRAALHALTFRLENGTTHTMELPSSAVRSFETIEIRGTDRADDLIAIDAIGAEIVLRGEAGNDRLTGSSGDDHLHGGWGNDLLRGGDGDDLLLGGGGNDVLEGEGGDDLLDGVVGNDVLRGGTGADLYRVQQPNRGAARYADWYRVVIDEELHADGRDILDLSASSPNPNGRGSDDAVPAEWQWLLPGQPLGLVHGPGATVAVVATQPEAFETIIGSAAGNVFAIDSETPPIRLVGGTATDRVRGPAPGTVVPLLLTPAFEADSTIELQLRAVRGVFTFDEGERRRASAAGERGWTLEQTRRGEDLLLTIRGNAGAIRSWLHREGPSGDGSALDFVTGLNFEATGPDAEVVYTTTIIPQVSEPEVVSEPPVTPAPEPVAPPVRQPEIAEEKPDAPRIVQPIPVRVQNAPTPISSVVSSVNDVEAGEEPPISNRVPQELPNGSPIVPQRTTNESRVVIAPPSRGTSKLVAKTEGPSTAKPIQFRFPEVADSGAVGDSETPREEPHMVAQRGSTVGERIADWFRALLTVWIG